MGNDRDHYLGRARPTRAVHDVDAQSTVRLRYRTTVDRLGAGRVPGHETPMPEGVPPVQDQAEAVEDEEIAEAVTAWQTWEDAINRTGQGRTPAWMRTNGRRWATEPGE